MAVHLQDTTGNPMTCGMILGLPVNVEGVTYQVALEHGATPVCEEEQERIGDDARHEYMGVRFCSTPPLLGCTAGP